MKIENSEHRNIILHYHLFKNAGTSIDQILKENFKGEWLEHEGSDFNWKPYDIADFLKQNKNIKALSSHTANLPLPEIDDATIYPIIFVRHPIDRIRSIYEFERKQIAFTEGSKMAKILDLKDFIQWRLSIMDDYSIRNFQAKRFSYLIPEIEGDQHLSEEFKVLNAIDHLPFVGLVERFDESLSRLQSFIRKAYPEISLKPVKLNVTQKVDSTLEQRLEDLKSEIGSKLYLDLLDSNSIDLKIFNKVSDNYKNFSIF